jgi:hypothetical protein
MESSAEIAPTFAEIAKDIRSGIGGGSEIPSTVPDLTQSIFESKANIDHAKWRFTITVWTPYFAW